MHIWFNCLNSSQRITSSLGNHTQGWGHTQRYNPCTTENPQALPQTGITRRAMCTVRLPAVAGQPLPLSVPAHLSSLPCPSHSSPHNRSSGTLGWVLGVLPHYLSMATTAQSSQSTSYANESRPQMSAVTTAPLPPYLISFLKSQRCILRILYLRTPSQSSHDFLRKIRVKPICRTTYITW